MLEPVLAKNDRRAGWLITIVSAVIFLVIVFLSRIQIPVPGDFDPHIFARINAIINTTVSILLVLGLVAIKGRKYRLHKRFMIAAMLLSMLFLVSYIAHHLFAGDTRFGGEGSIRYVYYFILITHIILAAIILPFILFTTYRALIAEWPRHRKIARVTFPIWLYVSVTGVLVYLMISPYY